MFDGLKDKLTSFTEDVEDDAEQDTDTDTDTDSGASVATNTARADQADGEHAAASADPDRSVAAARADDPDQTTADTAADSPPDQPAGGDAAASGSNRSGSGESDGEPRAPGPDEQASTRTTQTAAADPELTGETDEANETDSTDSTDEGGGLGLGERAKLLATGKTVIEADDLEEHLETLEFALLESDVELSVADEIIDGVEQNLVGSSRRRLESTGSLVRDAVRESVYDVISVGQFSFIDRIEAAESPVVVVFTGVNGVGKTTTIAKLADYLAANGVSSVLANGDTYRAGASEQLQEHAAALDTKLITHEKGSDPTAVIYDAVEYAKANKIDVVLGDTAGRLHTSDGLMDQLAKIDRVIDPDLTLFVDEAVAGQDAVHRAREFNKAAAIDGTVLTKADADPQGGAAISIAQVTGKPILFLGTGQGYGDIEPFDPEQVVDRLVGEE